MALGNSFVPLTLDLIEEGAFRAAVDRELRTMQNKLASHVEEWGDRAGKATAQLNITIKVTCKNVRDGHYVIEPKLSTKMPGRPSVATAAFAGPMVEDGCTTGELALFVRGTGSTPGDPTQMHLPMGGGSEKETPAKKGQE